ncbi:MAG: hypothetical protein M9962_14535 [Oligoflexia bacterium]|nr:hypothetical protein [Oligoflexia bacterium]
MNLFKQNFSKTAAYIALGVFCFSLPCLAERRASVIERLDGLKALAKDVGRLCGTSQKTTVAKESCEQAYNKITEIADAYKKKQEDSAAMLEAARSKSQTCGTGQNTTVSAADCLKSVKEMYGQALTAEQDAAKFLTEKDKMLRDAHKVLVDKLAEVVTDEKEIQAAKAKTQAEFSDETTKLTQLQMNARSSNSGITSNQVADQSRAVAILRDKVTSGKGVLNGKVILQDAGEAHSSPYNEPNLNNTLSKISGVQNEHRTAYDYVTQTQDVAREGIRTHEARATAIQSDIKQLETRIAGLQEVKPRVQRTTSGASSGLNLDGGNGTPTGDNTRTAASSANPAQAMAEAGKAAGAAAQGLGGGGAPPTGSAPNMSSLPTDTAGLPNDTNNTSAASKDNNGTGVADDTNPANYGQIKYAGNNDEYADQYNAYAGSGSTDSQLALAASRSPSGSGAYASGGAGGSAGVTAASEGGSTAPSDAGTFSTTGDLGVPSLNISGSQTASDMKAMANDFGLGDLFGDSGESVAEEAKNADKAGLFGSLEGNLADKYNNDGFDPSAPESLAANPELNDLTLFARVHATHERSIKKGLVILSSVKVATKKTMID